MFPVIFMEVEWNIDIAPRSVTGRQTNMRVFMKLLAAAKKFGGPSTPTIGKSACWEEEMNTFVTNWKRKITQVPVSLILIMFLFHAHFQNLLIYDRWILAKD